MKINNGREGIADEAVNIARGMEIFTASPFNLPNKLLPFNIV
jgi:hypothetical protein